MLRLQNCEKVGRVWSFELCIATIPNYIHKIFVGYIFSFVRKSAGLSLCSIFGVKTRSCNTRRTLSQFRSFKIRCKTFLNFIKFADPLILGLWNCESVRRVSRSFHKSYAVQKRRSTELEGAETLEFPVRVRNSRPIAREFVYTTRRAFWPFQSLKNPWIDEVNIAKKTSCNRF